MIRTVLKTLGASLLSLGLVLAGASLPAHSSGVVTFDSPVPTFVESSPTPSFSVTVNPGATLQDTAGRKLALQFGSLAILAGCPSTPSATLADCGVDSVTGTGTITSPNVAKSPNGLTLFINWTGNTSTVTVTFAQGAFTTSSTGQKTLTTTIQAPNLDIQFTPFNVVSAPTTFTVTFDANGGTGTMSDQTATPGTALTANSFTRSGYTFSGWNTAASGNGTAYANSATTFPFTSNSTLYAQWAANSSGGNGGNNPAGGSGESSPQRLANTGFFVLPLAVGGLSTALVGASLVVIARRRTQ